MPGVYEDADGNCYYRTGNKRYGYISCVEENNGCRARGVLSNDNKSFTLTTNHSEHTKNADKLINEIKRELEAYKTKNRTIVGATQIVNSFWDQRKRDLTGDELNEWTKCIEAKRDNLRQHIQKNKTVPIHHLITNKEATEQEAMMKPPKPKIVIDFLIVIINDIRTLNYFQIDPKQKSILPQKNASNVSFSAPFK